MSNSKFILYAVYFNPSDHPGKYVVRRWEGLEPDEKPLIVSNNLELARAAIPNHLYCLARCENDDPAILETWI